MEVTPSSAKSLGRRFLHRDMRRAAQALRVGLVQHRLEQVAIDAEDLEPVGTAGLGPSHALADGLRGLGRSRPSPPRGRVDEDARRDERVRRAVGPPFLGLLDVGPHVADRRHAAGEQEIGLVLERLRRAAAFVLQVHVRVDEAGHDVLPGCVDDGIGRRVLGRCRPDPGNPAVLHEDVGRPEGGLRVAVDDHRVANQQARDGFTVRWGARLGTCRSPGRLLGGDAGREESGQDDGGSGMREARNDATDEHVPSGRILCQRGKS